MPKKELKIIEELLFKVYNKGLQQEDCNLTEFANKIEKEITLTRYCTELKTVKQGDILLLDNKFDVEVITPESSVLIKHKGKDILIWVDKKRLKRK